MHWWNKCCIFKNSIKENKNITSYEAEEIYQEGELRNKWSKLTPIHNLKK